MELSWTIYKELFGSLNDTRGYTTGSVCACTICYMKLYPQTLFCCFFIILRQLWAPGKSLTRKEKQFGDLSVMPTMSCTRTLFSIALTAWKLNWSKTRCVCTVSVCVRAYSVSSVFCSYNILASFLPVGAPHKGWGVFCAIGSSPGESSRYSAWSKKWDSSCTAGPVHQRSSHTSSRPPQQEVCPIPLNYSGVYHNFL